MFVDYYNYVLGEINQIPRNKYELLVVDTGEKLEAGMAAYVDANKKLLGVTNTSYGRLWTEGVFPLYENLIQAIYDRGISTVILTFHLSAWVA